MGTLESGKRELSTKFWAVDFLYYIFVRNLEKLALAWIIALKGLLLTSREPPLIELKL